MTTLDSTVDWGSWPILHVRATTVADHEARAVVAGALRSALHRGQPFAAVVELPGAPARGRRIRGAVEHVRTLKQLRPGLAQHCRGLAFVLPVQAQHDNAKAIGAGAKLWGCPTTATHDVAAALAWTRGQLATDRATPPPAGP